MSLWPFRRRDARDTEPEPVDVTSGPGPGRCVRCDKVFRDSPGNWHVESPTEGLCNVCDDKKSKKEKERPYVRTKIGF